MELPTIDAGPLLERSSGRAAVASEIARACSEVGFFAVTGHGIPADLLERLESSARRFFSRPAEEKMRIAMQYGGRAWRGYFPVGSELTSGEPDCKEGLYFGAELGPDHPLVIARTPLHGANLFLPDDAALRDAVLAYIDALTALGHALVEGISLSLGLPADAIARHVTQQPLVLFRIFRYPPSGVAWGAGEHTDYGLLTLLLQDGVPGLEIRSRGQWVDVPAQRGTFVCNIGDMLEHVTRGRYRSTTHRVRNASTGERLSFPFFFDPGFHAPIVPLVVGGAQGNGRQLRRWDGASVSAFEGTYGEYIVRKVTRVFPQLADDLADTP